MPDLRDLVGGRVAPAAAFWMPVCAALFAAVLLAGCRQPPQGHGRIAELRIEERAEGSGRVAEPGTRVSVHYTGWLYDDRAPQSRGTQFDSSRERGVAFSFLLGAGQVIRGWDRGVEGMREGGRRVLWLPPEYGYGARGAGDRIGPDASLVFEVELLAVEEG